MCPIIEINLHKRDYSDYLLWCIIWNCWCKRHSCTKLCSTKLAKSPAWTSESAVRERGGEGGRGRGRGGGGRREGGWLVGNAHRRRDTVGAPSVAVMRVRARVRWQWRRPDGAARAAERAVGGGALMLGAGGALEGIPDPRLQRPDGRAGGIRADRWGHESKSVTWCTDI